MNRRMQQQLQKQERRGVQVLESILVIPFLAITLAAMVQLGATMSVQEAVEAAADEGAREAAKAAATATNPTQIVDAATEAVNEVLSVHGLALTANSGVRIILAEDAAASPVGDAGDASVTQIQTFPAPGQGELRVIILVKFDPTAAPNPDPIPNLLQSFGVDLANKQFEVSAIAKKE